MNLELLLEDVEEVYTLVDDIHKVDGFIHTRARLRLLDLIEAIEKEIGEENVRTANYWWHEDPHDS